MSAPSVTEHLPCRLDLVFDWTYAHDRADLRALYEKAKRNQWLPDEVLPWDTDVDLEKPAAPEWLHPLHGSDLLARLSPKERTRLDIELNTWTLSQFLHGEQGALLAASQLVQVVPDTDSKCYAATQVVDEARHVEVYERYLQEKVGFSYPINRHLRTLLDLILQDGRWDMKLLGMQVMVEGLALAAFGMIRQHTLEPLLRELTHHVMLDEARHVAYGVLSLRDLYGDLPEREVAEREDFVYEAAVLMRDRFLFQEVWEKQGMPVEECVGITFRAEGQRMFRQLLFSKIVPAVKKIGLLSERQRARFAELGILQFESWADPFADLEAKPGS